MTMRNAAELDVVDTLPQRVGRLTRLLYRHSTGELSRTETGILSTLSDGPRRITGLADHEGLAQPTVTVVVGKMEERGLVSRRRDPSDGRVVLVQITDDGRAALERFRARYREVLEERVASMTEEEVASLRTATDALGVLIDALQRGD